ncbi:MAG: GNAT family N-acetyltransferase, partial [Planctomycetes bacterium]|nr:GNAT family N-acetyltransferase [Planctomycetota bacterium]
MQRLGYAAKLKEQISRYTTENRSALVEFQREMFGQSARQQLEEHFQWLFELNPFRRDDGAELWLCKKDGRVVGQQAGIPFELTIRSHVFRASWAVDLMVHPQWRLRGVGAALSQTYVESNDIVAGLGISDAAYKAFLRAGWTDLGCIPLYVRPLDVGAMLRGRSSTSHLAQAAATGLRPLVWLVDAACDVRARWSGATLEPVEQFDHRVDELWKAVAPCYPVIARRDYT